MNRVRGMLMLAAACVAFWQAWRLHHGNAVWLALVLGVLALALGVWHLTRKPPQLRL